MEYRINDRLTVSNKNNDVLITNGFVDVVLSTGLGISVDSGTTVDDECVLKDGGFFSFNEYNFKKLSCIEDPYYFERYGDFCTSSEP